MGRKRLDADPDGLELHANGYWYFKEWSEKHGKHVPRSTKKRDREEAREVRRALEATGQWRTIDGADMTIGIARRHYIERHKVNAPRVIEQCWMLAKDRVEDCKLADPKTRQAIHALKDKLLETYAPRSVRNVLNHLTAVMNFVAKTSLSDRDDTPIYNGPLPRLTLPSDKMHPTRRRKASTLWFTREQILQLLAYVIQQSARAGRITVDHRIIVMIYEGGGQRAQRIGYLPRKNINLKRGLIDFANIPGIPYSSNKTGVEEMPIEGAAFNAFLARCEAEANGTSYFLDDPMTRDAIYARLRRIYRNVLGIEYGGPHALRKTVAKHMAKYGARDKVAFTLGIDEDTARTFYIGDDTDTARAALAAVPETPLTAEPTGDNVVTLKKA